MSTAASVARVRIRRRVALCAATAKFASMSAGGAFDPMESLISWLDGTEKLYKNCNNGGNGVLLKKL
jgi:hypothetical protein